MSFDDWLLSLHLLSAFAFVGGLVLFWILVVAVRRTDTPDATVRMGPVVKVGNIAVGVGAGGTIVLGIWLAIALERYHVWDGWVIAALVLWVIATATGQRTGAAYMQGMNKAEELQAAGQDRPERGAARAQPNLARCAHALPDDGCSGPDPRRHDLQARRMNVFVESIRPNDWDWVLLLHVSGAMILVGGTLTAASALVFARGDAQLLRFGYWSLLAVGLPGYVLMRVGAEWLASKEGYHGRRRARAHVDRDRVRASRTSACLSSSSRSSSAGSASAACGAGKGTALLKTTMVISVILLAAYIVAIWAMAGKPELGAVRRARRRRRVGGDSCSDARFPPGWKCASTFHPLRPRAPHQGARDRPSDTRGPLA